MKSAALAADGLDKDSIDSESRAVVYYSAARAAHDGAAGKD